MDKKRIAGILCLLVILIGLWSYMQNRGTMTEMSEGLTITALSVGKADALIIQSGEQVILMDTGEEDDGSYIEAELKRRGIEKVDLLLITHFDKDHVGSAAYLLEQMEIDCVYMPDYEGTRPEYAAFLEVLNRQTDTKSSRITKVQSLELGDMKLTIYPAENRSEIMDGSSEYDNDFSLVTSLRFKNCSFLLTGDIEKTRIRQMLGTNVNWKHDWIKIPHHGNYQKALKELVDAVQPQYAVICCSQKEPAEEKTLELLQQKGVQVYDTVQRAVITQCDGTNIAIRQE